MPKRSRGAVVEIAGQRLPVIWSPVKGVSGQVPFVHHPDGKTRRIDPSQILPRTAQKVLKKGTRPGRDMEQENFPPRTRRRSRRIHNVEVSRR